jgi:two-component system chemotaxis sensor kinase CheA
MRRFKVTTRSSDADLLDLFGFHVAREQVQILPFGPGYGFYPAQSRRAADTSPAPLPPVAVAPQADPGYGFFDDAPGAPGEPGPASRGACAAGSAAQGGRRPSVGGGPRHPRAASRPQREGPRRRPGLHHLRVSVEKVDQLINLVGELVITQAMLAQNSRDLDPALPAAGGGLPTWSATPATCRKR